jgi:hypothetical protein
MARWERLLPETHQEAGTAPQIGPTAGAISGSMEAKVTIPTEVQVVSTIFGNISPTQTPPLQPLAWDLELTPLRRQ